MAEWGIGSEEECNSYRNANPYETALDPLTFPYCDSGLYYIWQNGPCISMPYGYDFEITEYWCEDC
jgi:hypothetical protein